MSYITSIFMNSKTWYVAPAWLFIHIYIYTHEHAFTHTCIRVGLVYTLLRYCQLIIHSSIRSEFIYMYKQLLHIVAQAKKYS